MKDEKADEPEPTAHEIKMIKLLRSIARSADIGACILLLMLIAQLASCLNAPAPRLYP